MMGRYTEGVDLGMGRRRLQGLSAVIGASNNLALEHNDGTYRYLSEPGSSFCKAKRHAHEVAVVTVHTKFRIQGICGV